MKSKSKKSIDFKEVDGQIQLTQEAVNLQEKIKKIESVITKGDYFMFCLDHEKQYLYLTSSFLPIKGALDEKFLAAVYESLFKESTLAIYALNVRFLYNLLIAHPAYDNVKAMFEGEEVEND